MIKVYTIRDVKAGYGCQQGVPALIDMPNDEYALRVLKASCQAGAKPNALNTFPEDKELWCVGEFDQETGMLKTDKPPYLIGRAIDYIEVAPNDKVD